MRSFSVGQPLHRGEDDRLVRGNGRYVDDIDQPGVGRAYFLRSPHAHARIVAIDTTAARALPGVIAVLTAEDYLADGGQPVPYGFHRPVNTLGVESFFPTRMPLAHGRVRFVGDGVALIIAETLNLARDAAELIDVSYDSLPAVVATDHATDPGSATVWDERPDNVCFVHEAGDKAAVEAAIVRTPYVFRQRFVISRVAAAPMEVRGCLADFDPATGISTLHAGVQDVYGTRASAAKALGIAESALHVVAPDVGGSFGLKTVDPETVGTIWASRRLQRPVKWISDRSESFAGDNHGRDNVTMAELATDAEGTFLALKVDTYASVGAYASLNGSAPPVGNLGSLAGVYRTPAIFVRVKGVFTNSVSTGPYRGAGRPEASYVIERMVDLAARTLGIDPIAIRRRNMIPADAMPFKTGLTYTYDSGEFERVMDRALGMASYSDLASRRVEARQRGKILGCGLAAVIERATLTGTSETVEIRCTQSGEVLVMAGSTDQGQGHRTMYTQVVCDQLGIDPDRVTVMEGDTRRLPAGGMTGSSRVSAMGSGAAVDAIRTLVRKGRAIAAKAFDRLESDVEFAQGRFFVPGTNFSAELGELAKIAEGLGGSESGLLAVGAHKAAVENFPNGFHVCEVEIDPETGQIGIVRYVVVDDVGTVINPLLVKGQIHGGIVQGAGQVLMETVVYDRDTGQLLTGSFQDYAMPRAADFCSFEVASHPVPTATNPLGVKGVGEAGTVGALPAVMNAVVDALASLGIKHLDMPATSERIWRAIHRRSGSPQSAD